MEEAQELSDRVGIIDHGDLIALGTQEELTRQVGQSDTLVLHFGDDQNPAALAEAARALPNVEHAELDGEMVRLITSSAEAVLAGVVGKATELGLKIRSIEIQEPNLEAVFLHLTGRALRD